MKKKTSIIECITLTRESICDLLNLSASKLDEIRQTDTNFPKPVLNRRNMLFSRADILAWWNERVSKSK